MVLAMAKTAALGGLACAVGCRAAEVDAPNTVRVAQVFWQAPITAMGPPAIDDSSVYFSTRDHYLAAVNRKTGDVRWAAYSDVSGSPPARDTPVRAADVVVFGDEYLYGFELKDGARRWVFGKTGGIEPRVGIYPFRTDGTHVYAGSVIGAAFAVDGGTGLQVWRADLVPGGSDNQVRVIAVQDNRVYCIVRFNGPFYVARAYALDAATGAVVWSYEMGRSSLADEAVLSPLGQSGSLFLLMLDDGRIVALDPATGGVRWTIARVAVGTTSDDRRMTVSGNVLVATSTGGTSASRDFIAGYDFTSTRELWRVQSDQGSAQGNLNRVTSDADLAYIPFTDGVIGAYELATGTRQWLRRPPVGLFMSAPLISHDTMFVAGWDAAYAIAK